MAIVQINPDTGDFDYEKLQDTQTKTYKGKAEITLSNYDNDSAPQVQAGSIFACNGALYENNSDVTPASYSSIANSTTFYLYFDPSTDIFLYSISAPVWSDDKQGWYFTGSNIRAFFSMYKDSGGTLYEKKGAMLSPSTTAMGGVGTTVIAASNAWARSTEYLPGTTVAGNTLYVSSVAAGSRGSSMSSLNTSDNYVLNTSWQSLNFTGTWRLLARVYQAQTGSGYDAFFVIGMLQRIQ